MPNPVIRSKSGTYWTSRVWVRLDIRRQISECWKGLREREPTLVHADESVASAQYDVVQQFDAQKFAR